VNLAYATKNTLSTILLTIISRYRQVNFNAKVDHLINKAGIKKA